MQHWKGYTTHRLEIVHLTKAHVYGGACKALQAAPSTLVKLGLAPVRPGKVTIGAKYIGNCETMAPRLDIFGISTSTTGKPLEFCALLRTCGI
eukprot:gene12150-biopygen1886